MEKSLAMAKQSAGTEDLLTDESFLSWYFKTDERAVRQWDQWISEDPELRAGAEEAVAFLQSMVREEPPVDQLRWAEDRLMDRIATLGVVAIPGNVGIRRRRRHWMVAASTILVIAGIYGGSRLMNRKIGMQTAYGEIRSRQLPDGSEVLVNANSRLVWFPVWKDGMDREVWMSGEAFFHVSKTALKSRFIVHTHRCDIIVTGTQFNVIDRPDKTNILLKEGSITLKLGNERILQMHPGDFMEFTEKGIGKKTVRTDSLLAWKDHKLIFDGTPIRELVRIIREQYGVTVKLADERLGERTLYGILPNENLDILLRSLETTGEYTVKKEGAQIMIMESNPGVTQPK